MNEQKQNHAVDVLERTRAFVNSTSCKDPAGDQPPSIDELAELLKLADDRQAEIERLESVINNPTLAGLQLYRRAMEIGLEGGPVQMFAEAFAEQFKDSNALNYIEMTMRPTDHAIGQLIVTVQRVAGKTPHQLRLYAESKIPAAIEAMRELAIAEIPAAAEYCYPVPIIDDIRKIDAKRIIQGLEKA